MAITFYSWQSVILYFILFFLKKKRLFKKNSFTHRHFLWSQSSFKKLKASSLYIYIYIYMCVCGVCVCVCVCVCVSEREKEEKLNMVIWLNIDPKRMLNKCMWAWPVTWQACVSWKTLSSWYAELKKKIKRQVISETDNWVLE